jgi:hypothetical protein
MADLCLSLCGHLILQGNLNYFQSISFSYTGLTFDQILEKNWIELYI